MKNALLFLLVCLLPVGLFAQQGDNNRQKALVFTHVTVIDATGAPAKPDMTVVVRGDRIEALGKTANLDTPENAHVVDATDKFLIPGLWDMHIHPLDEKDYLALFIANGVTGVRVMRGEPVHHKWRQEISSGKLIGPRMVIASPLLGGSNTTRGFVVVSNEEEGRQVVRKVKKEGADFIKVYSYLPRDAYFAIADEAKKQGIPFAGHVPFSVSAAETSDAGQQSAEHYYFVLLACSTEGEEELKKKIKETVDTDPFSLPHVRARIKILADITYSEKKAVELFARFVKNSTWVCPTLIVWHGLSFRDEEDLANDPRLKYMPLSTKDSWKNDVHVAWVTGEGRADHKKLCEKHLAIVGAMRRAGVGLLAGTDTPFPYCFPGFGLHDELALFVQSGLSPMEALQTATYNPAKCFGKLDSMGTIEQGKIADLVLLDADPLQDISNTQKIAAVVVGGKIFDKTALQKMLAQVEAARLGQAAADGEIEHVKLLISEGADVNARDQQGWTPALAALNGWEWALTDLLLEKGADTTTPHLAAYTGDLRGIKSLLEKDAPVDSLEGLTLLHAAAAGGHKDVVELLIAKGANVNAENNKGKTPVDFAQSRNRKAIVELLIARGANISLHAAVRFGDLAKVENILEDGADVDAKDRGGYTPLYYAIWNEDKDTIKLLVAKGADVSFTPKDDYPPLHYAVWNDDMELAELLVNNGAKFDAKDRYGWTAFRYAASGANRELVEFFVSKGADLSSFHGAACVGDLARVKAFVQQGTDINTKDEMNWTALYWAASTGQQDVAEYLIAKGADVGARAEDSSTPLHKAAKAGDRKIVELFISKGADVNAKDKRGNTPLYSAASAGHRDIAELLIVRGASVDARGKNDWTPIHRAARAGHKDVVEMLVKKGADVNAKDNRGRTALWYAKEEGHTEIVELLRKYGAKE